MESSLGNMLLFVTIKSVGHVPKILIRTLLSSIFSSIIRLLEWLGSKYRKERRIASSLKNYISQCYFFFFFFFERNYLCVFQVYLLRTSYLLIFINVIIIFCFQAENSTAIIFISINGLHGKNQVSGRSHYAGNLAQRCILLLENLEKP